MFGLKKLKNEILKLKTAYENDSIALKGLMTRVEQIENSNREIFQDWIEIKHDIEGEKNVTMKTLCTLGNNLCNLEEKVERIEKRSKPGRKPKALKDGKTNS